MSAQKSHVVSARSGRSVNLQAMANRIARLSLAARTPVQWKAFARRFRAEMKSPTARHDPIQDTMGWADRDFDPEAFDLARVEFRGPEKYCRQTFSPRRKRG